MAKYQYVDAADKLQTVEAASAEAAMAAAKNIGKSSGVMLVPPKVDKVKTSTDAGKLGKGSLPDVPPAPQSGSAADLAYSIGSSMPGVSDAKNAAAAFAPAAGPIETSYAELVRSMQQDISSIAGKSKTRAELLQEEGVNANKELINQYTQQLQQEQRALSKTTSALYEGEAGFMTAGYADKKAQDIQRRSLSKQADIAIAANAAQGNIEAALEIVDQKLQVKYGEAEDRLALQKQYIELLSPLMSAEQQRTATARQNELSLYAADLNQKRDLERMDYQAKLQRQQAAYESGLRASEAAATYGPVGEVADKNLSFFLNNAKLNYGKTAASQKLLEQAFNQNVALRGAAGGYETLLGTAFSGTDQKALDGIREAQEGYKRLDAFYAANPDFDTSYVKQKANDIAKYAGGQDPTLTEFNAITNEIESSLRALKTGLSLTGFELDDSTQRYFTKSDTVASYTKKMENLRSSLDAQLGVKVDGRLGSGFYEGYKSSLVGGTIPDDDWNAPPSSAPRSSGALSMDSFNRVSGSGTSGSSAGALTLPSDFSGFSNYLFR